jgi:hypothetical protein
MTLSRSRGEREMANRKAQSAKTNAQEAILDKTDRPKQAITPACGEAFAFALCQFALLWKACLSIVLIG